MSMKNDVSMPLAERRESAGTSGRMVKKQCEMSADGSGMLILVDIFYILTYSSAVKIREGQGRRNDDCPEKEGRN